MSTALGRTLLRPVRPTIRAWPGEPHRTAADAGTAATERMHEQQVAASQDGSMPPSRRCEDAPPASGAGGRDLLRSRGATRTREERGCRGYVRLARPPPSTCRLGRLGRLTRCWGGRPKPATTCRGMEEGSITSDTNGRMTRIGETVRGRGLPP